MPAAFAAHPLASEDALTQGAGHWEVELGSALTRQGGDRGYELGPQLSYGASDTLDLIARPTWLDLRTVDDEGARRTRGLGDGALDLKWRFLTVPNGVIALRGGLGAPTGDRARGLGSGRTTLHLLLAATAPVASFSLHGNVGWTQNRDDAPARRSLLHLSSAAVWNATPSVRVLLADLTLDTEPDPRVGRSQSAWRTGLIGIVRSGFDLDLGYQARLGRSGPGSIVLAGATLRW